MLSSSVVLSNLITPTQSSNETVDVSTTSGEHERGILHRLPGIQLITEWPQGTFVENLAAKHDGHLLVTLYSENEIYEVNPNLSQSNRVLLAKLPGGPTGIVELDYNHFYVNVGTIGQRNTWGIYRIIPHRGTTPTNSFKQIRDIDSALFLNGVCVLSYEHGTLLSVDSMLGQIFKINVHTKQVELWYENDLLKKRSHDLLIPGINGIRRCSIDNCLYLTNTDRAIILRIAIDPYDYRPKGQLEVVMRNIVCDDFSIDRAGVIYATTHVHDSLMRLTPVKDGEYLREELAIFADGLAGATSCIFGRTYHDRTCLYITTTGGVVQTHKREIRMGLQDLHSNIPAATSTGKLLKLDIGVTTGLYEPPTRILVICSSHSRGIHLNEFAEVYNKLRRKFGGKEKVEFIVTSPKGGSVPIDPTTHPRTELQSKEWSSAIRLLSQSTHPILDTQKASDYDAVYLPGGHGSMFDLIDHPHLKQLLADFDVQMKPIAAIGHGVVGLIHVRRSNDNSALIHGRMLTGFSLEEEFSSGEDKKDLVVKTPFILENKLKESGAVFIKVQPGTKYVLQDGLLLTGQNTASAEQLAHCFNQLIEQCSAQDYQQVNLTSSLPKTLITCHVALTHNNPHILSRLKLAHLEYIQRHQHIVVLSGSTLFTDISNVTHQDASTMVILLATSDLRQAQHFIEHEPYTASKQIFDVTHIKPFKPLLPCANNQQLLNYHIQQESIKNYQHQSHRERHQ